MKENHNKVTSELKQEKGNKCNDKQNFLTSNWIDKLKVYQTCMDHEQIMRTSYQGLLATLEVALLLLFFTLYQLQLREYLWVLSVAGIYLCLFFGITCEYRARNVDIWRVRITKLVIGTDMECDFKEGNYRWIPFGKIGFWWEYLFGHWFERILVSTMLIIWLSLLWLFPCPFIIRCCGILATLFWIVYAFRVVELKGEIIPYIYTPKYKHQQKTDDSNN